MDEGKHKIIFSVRRDNDNNDEEVVIEKEYVRFEKVIQQIGKQFNINYLWYDQMCIHQNDKEEKELELRNIHLIYSNAYCTVALVPEFRGQSEYNNEQEKRKHLENVCYMIHKNHWFTRLWTFIEAIMSNRLLVVGQNIHSWGGDLSDGFFSELKRLSQPCVEQNIQRILYHIYLRHTNKDHNRIFALANLFLDIIDKMTINYDQPIEDVMIQFYGYLAKKNICILIFNRPRNGYNSTIQKYKKFLPSWTGVHGVYETFLHTTSTFQNYHVIGKIMQVICSYITNDNDQQQSFSKISRAGNSLVIQKEDIPSIPDYNQKNRFCLGVSVYLPGSTLPRTIVFISATYSIFENKRSRKMFSDKIRQLSRFFTNIKKEGLCWVWIGNGLNNTEVARIDLNKLAQVVLGNNDSPLTQYVLLAGISFKEKMQDHCDHYYYPIIKKKQGEEYWEAIGACSILNAQYFFNGCHNLPKEMFSIH